MDVFSAVQVAAMIDGWKKRGDSKAQLAAEIAEACIGWPYVWGSLGEECGESKRRAYMNRDVCPAGDKELIRKRCQVLNGSSGSCNGCKYYPNGQRTRIFDCRGFTRWVLAQAGCGTIQGGGATSQYNTAANWSQRGPISQMPDVVCCVFKDVNGVKEHTGLHIGGGVIIHCSVEVKRGSTSEKGWTHYAIPKNIDGQPAPSPEPAPEPSPEPAPAKLPTLRKGDRGQYVTLLQTKLINKGYSCGSSGADGIFGNDTLYAVKKFQLDAALEMDGICGAKTWAALDSSAPIQTYTVHIPFLPKYKAEALISQYTGASMTPEESGS